MSPQPLTVAFIGLGRMGSAMARHIQKAGFHLIVFNRTASKTRPFVAAGARAAHSPREAAAIAEVVVTSLDNDQTVLDVTTGPNGILASLRPGAVHLGLSTISPHATRQLTELHRAHGSQYVAAPVLGRPDVAEAGKLRTFVAGEPAAIELARPVLESFTSEIIRAGTDPSAAGSLKLLANFILVSTMELMSEAYVLGEKRGLDQALVTQLVESMVPNPAMQAYGKRIRDRKYDETGFTLELGLKDVRLMLEASGEVAMPLPTASLIREKMLTAIARGLGDQDWSAFTATTRWAAGLD